MTPPDKPPFLLGVGALITAALPLVLCVWTIWYLFIWRLL